MGHLQRLLAALALITALTGAYLTLVPHSFYRHVVGVDLLGRYNDHLLSDVGGFYLGFAVLFAWAARRPTRQLAGAACAAFGLSQALHFIYHLVHLDDFTLVQAVIQTIVLLVLLVLPVAGLIMSRRLAWAEQAKPGSRDSDL